MHHISEEFIEIYTTLDPQAGDQRTQRDKNRIKINYRGCAELATEDVKLYEVKWVLSQSSLNTSYLSQLCRPLLDL